MNAKTLGVLSIATVALAGGAFLMTRKPEAPVATTNDKKTKLFDGLTTKLSSVTTIEMKDDKRTLVLRRADGKSPWTVADRFDYPAMQDQVNSTLVTLASMTILEEKTSKPERYSRIGVEDPSAAGSTGKLVTLKDSSGAVVASVIIGTTGEAGAPTSSDRSAVHVRKAGEASSYLVNGSVRPDADPMSCIERTILQLDRNRIKTVNVTRIDDPLFSADDPAKTNVLDIYRDTEKDLNFKVKNLPPGRTLRHEGAGDQPASVLGYLYIEDVRPVDQVDFNKIEAAAGPVKADTKNPPVRSTSKFVTFDGLVITLKTTKQDGKHWLALSAAFDPAEVVPVPPAPEVKPGEKAPEQPKRKSADEVKKEADDLNAKLGKWAYAVPEYSMSQLAARVGDLLADPPAKPEQPGPPAGTPTAPGIQPIEPIPQDGGGILTPETPK